MTSKTLRRRTDALRTFSRSFSHEVTPTSPRHIPSAISALMNLSTAASYGASMSVPAPEGGNPYALRRFVFEAGFAPSVRVTARQRGGMGPRFAGTTEWGVRPRSAAAIAASVRFPGCIRPQHWSGRAHVVGGLSCAGFAVDQGARNHRWVGSGATSCFRP